MKGVFSIFACQSFGDKSYLAADMSVTCYDDIQYVYGGCCYFTGSLCIRYSNLRLLHITQILPGIHYDPTMPISKFNPSAGREYVRADRGELHTEA